MTGNAKAPVRWGVVYCGGGLPGWAPTAVRVYLDEDGYCQPENPKDLPLLVEEHRRAKAYGFTGTLPVYTLDPPVPGAIITNPRDHQ